MSSKRYPDEFKIAVVRQVVDLFSRQVMDGSIQSRMRAIPVLKVLWMAVCLRKPFPGVLIHAGQGSQYTGGEWKRLLTPHELECSMSRRGNS